MYREGRDKSNGLNDSVRFRLSEFLQPASAHANGLQAFCFIFIVGGREHRSNKHSKHRNNKPKRSGHDSAPPALYYNQPSPKRKRKNSKKMNKSVNNCLI